MAKKLGLLEMIIYLMASLGFAVVPQTLPAPGANPDN